VSVQDHGAERRDGTPEHPFRNLDEAFAGAHGGEIFVMGKGRHGIDGVFPFDLKLWGACASETELIATHGDENAGTVTALDGATVEVRNVTILGPTPGLRVQGGAVLRAQDVLVTGAEFAGAVVLDGTLEAHDIAVRDSALRDGGWGRALTVAGGGSAEIERAVFERVYDMAVQIGEAGSSATLTEVAIADITPDEVSRLGQGVEVVNGATATLSRTIVEAARDTGLYVDDGATVMATDLLVRGIRSGPDGTFGRGVNVQSGGRLTGQRVAVDDCRELGVYAGNEGSRLELTDVVVRRTDGRERDDVGGRGVQIQWGAQATLERAVIAENLEHGLFVASEGTQVTAQDTVIEGTLSHPDMGRGAEVLLGATLTLSRVRLEENHDVALFVTDGSTATLEDLAVVRTLPRPATGWYGRAINVQGEGASATGARVDLEGNTEIALFVAGGGSVSLSRARLAYTVPQLCFTPCDDKSGGIGLFTVDTARATLTDFSIEDNLLAGVVVQGESQAILTSGTIARHPVGLHAADPDRVLAEMTDVSFADNQRNVDSTMLPIPDPQVPGEIDF